MKYFVFLFGFFPETSLAVSASDVVKTYCDIAQQNYRDALIGAKTLQSKVAAFMKNPSPESHAAAKRAWVNARIPYQQTEVFRFGNQIVDDWEGKVNAWPLDEGFIDYVHHSYSGNGDNPYRQANIIATPKLKIGSATFDARILNRTTLRKLHEIDDIESNVATGYHAIEFLLWGQDLNGHGPGAGARPYTDLDKQKCTHGHCDRRRDYLVAVTDLLVEDLEFIVKQWGGGGEARSKLMKDPGGEGLRAILTGMGSLSYGELSGERMKLGLMLNDPEEEHDCFSDNTHWSHYYNALGIQNVYLGRYRKLNDQVLEGPSLSQLVSKANKKLDVKIRSQLRATQAGMQRLVDAAKNGQAYDQLLKKGNKKGEVILMSIIEALTAQTRSFEKVVPALKLSRLQIEGSDSLDHPEKVGK